MFSSSVLDVGVGLIFVYLILGLMCTTVNEWIAQCFKMRSTTLKDGIRGLLSGPPEGAARIAPEEISAVKLVNRLAAPNGKLATALGLDQVTIEGYQAQLMVDPASVARTLADKLNAVSDDAMLYRKIDLGKASAAVLTEARKHLSGKRLQLVNHALLREAYSDGIAGLAQSFYSHPLIRSLSKPGEHPSYVPARTFAMAVIDILSRGAQPLAAGQGVPDEGREKAADGTAPVNRLDTIQASIGALPDCDAKRSLLTLLQNADHQVSTFEKNIEAWFEDSMDRVSGWYKNKAQIITIIVASCITIFANADTVQIARKLFLNPAIREKIAQEASVAKGTNTGQDQTPPGLTPQEKEDLGELTGWSAEFKTFHQLKAKYDGHPSPSAADDDTFPGIDLVREQRVFWPWLWAIAPTHLLGWILTAVAASLGAPFWFDTLNKFMNIRAAGTAPNEKGRDTSKV